MSDASRHTRGDYDFDLVIKLQTLIQNHEIDRSRYWESRLEGPEWAEWSPLKDLLAEADEIADLLRKRAAALRNVGDITEVNRIHQLYIDAVERAAEPHGGWEALEKGIRAHYPSQRAEELLAALKALWFDPDGGRPGDPVPLRLVWERLCIDDAVEVVYSIEGRVDRTFRLEKLVSEVLGAKQLSPLCLRYLALVSRCYVYGFDPECVAMCRSAMDEAFRECITDDDCHRAGRHRDVPTLDDRIEAAFSPMNRLLATDSSLRTAAELVQEFGNKAVHGDPDAVKDVLGTVERAFRVIDALSKLEA